MTNTRLITAPNVQLIATNTMTAAMMASWATSESLTATLHDNNTPLGKLYQNLQRSESHYSTELGFPETPEDLLPEFAGRFCYRSFDKGRETSEYLANILEHGHGSVLEHGTLTLAISGVSRSLTHELVRHRAGFAISQESQRYVDAKDIMFVVPPLLLHAWGGIACSEAEDWEAEQLRQVESYETWQEYLTEFAIGEGLSKLMAKKRANEAARASLPNCCETRLVWTGNFRALRHVIELRGAEGADLEIRRLVEQILGVVQTVAPRNFFDMDVQQPDDGVPIKTHFGIPVLTAGHKKV